MYRFFIACLLAIVPINMMAQTGAECYPTTNNYCPTDCYTNNYCPTDCFSNWFCDLDFGLGIYYDEKVDAMLPYLTVLWQYVTLGFGVNGTREGTSGDRATRVNFVGHAGLRFNIVPCTYFTVGASGMISSLNGGGTSDLRSPWIAGPYVGLDYHATRHILFSAQIMPWNRQRHFFGNYENEFFTEGQIGMTYMF